MSIPAIATSHKVHGLGTGLEAPAWPAITEDEARAVLVHFPTAGPLEQLDWHSPRPFSAAAMVRAGGGELLVKRHHRSLRTPEGLAEEHGFIAHLRRRGLPVAKVLPARNGDSAVMIGEWTYEVHRKAPGQDLYRERRSWTPFLSSVHASEAGAALARLHRAAVDYAAPARRLQPLVSSFSILPSDDPLAAAQASVAARPALGDFLSGRRWQRRLAHLFAALGKGLSARLQALPPVWTHNDWHASNLLWDEGGQVAAVIDFGLADRTSALHDLALAIERNAVAWLRLEHGDDGIADAAAARALMAGYASVIRLSDGDIATLLQLLPLVHVEFALSEVNYFHGILRSRADAALAWDGYLIGHAQWFLTAPGQAFLGELSHSSGR